MKRGANCTDIHDDPDWLEQVWMEVQNEIDYEKKHPQPEWGGTSMYPRDAPERADS